jgi:hypothetical protein
MGNEREVIARALGTLELSGLVVGTCGGGCAHVVIRRRSDGEVVAGIDLDSEGRHVLD